MYRDIYNEDRRMTDQRLDPPELPEEWDDIGGFALGSVDICDECGKPWPCKCVQAERELEREWQE